MSDDHPPELTDDEFQSALDRHELRPAEQGTEGWTLGRVVAAMLVVGTIVFWVWAFSPLAPRGHPDELDDPAFANAADPHCTAAVDQLADLPLASDVTSMAERADLIDDGTAIYRELVESLRALAPDPSSEDGDLVRRWLDDYDIYLSDRDAYAAQFRRGVDEAFTVSVKGQDQITDPIDQFAIANGVEHCGSPRDV